MSDMSDGKESDITAFVRRLHSTYHIETKIEPRQDGDGWEWEATLSGEDFLDGYWAATRTGTEKTFKKALRRTIEPTKKDPWIRRYRDRDEWSEEELADHPFKRR